MTIHYVFKFIVRLGNEKFGAKDYDGAIAHYNNAIQIDGENAVYYSNRR